MKNNTENEAKTLVLDLFLCFWKVVYKVITSGQHLSFEISW